MRMRVKSLPAIETVIIRLLSFEDNVTFRDALAESIPC